MILPSIAFSQQAFIRDLAGTVELKFAERNVWENAHQGQTLAANTIISTGFRSTAVLVVGNSFITVRPLTRLTLTEIITIDETEKTELNLRIGSVRADVAPPPGGKVEFTVRSSSATTSVRGTLFEVDILGVTVLEGVVQFEGFLSAPVLIDAGGYSRVDEFTGQIIFPVSAAINELTPDLPVAAGGTVQELFQPPGQAVPASVPLHIKVYGD